MPSSATITSFYTFAANSKARATQVNTNFSNYRGHIIAIDPSTITASNETYDLGSTEYRWRTGYFRDIDIKANTTTGQSLSIIGDTAAGQGAFLIKQGGNVRARIGGGNQYIDLDTTTSQFDFKIAGVTSASMKISGIPRSYNTPSTIYSSTISAGGGGYASTDFSTVTAILLGTLSLSSNGHKTAFGINLSPDIRTTSFPMIRFVKKTKTLVSGADLVFYRDGTGAANIIAHFYQDFPVMITTTGGNIAQYLHQILFFDTSITSGNHTYYIYGKSDNSADVQATLEYSIFQAMEVI
jgi:hypothetical protein